MKAFLVTLLTLSVLGNGYFFYQNTVLTETHTNEILSFSTGTDTLGLTQSTSGSQSISESGVMSSFMEDDDISYNTSYQPNSGVLKVIQDGNLVYEYPVLSTTGSFMKIDSINVTKKAHPNCESDSDRGLGYSVLAQDSTYALVQVTHIECAKDGWSGILLFSKVQKKLIDLADGAGGLLVKKFGYILSGGREQCPTDVLPMGGGILVRSCSFSGTTQDAPFGIPFTRDGLSKFSNQALGTWFGYGKKNGKNYDTTTSGHEYLYNESIVPFSAFIPQDVITEAFDSGLYDYTYEDIFSVHSTQIDTATQQ